jgi:hypothetical protein
LSNAGARFLENGATGAFGMIFISSVKRGYMTAAA